MVSDSIDRQRLVAMYERRLALDAASRAFLPLAELYRADGRLAESRQALEAGLARHPRFLSAHVALARVLLELGEPARARDLLAAVLARDPDNLVALRLQADAAQARADWAEADAHLARVVRLDPHDEDAADRWQAARRRAAAPAAAAPRPAALAAAGSPADVVTVTLAGLLLDQGKFARARELLARIDAAEPGRADVRALRDRLEAAAAAAPPATAPAAAAPRRRTSEERREERQQFARWAERAGEE